jgi:hypothetical protein
MSVFEDIHFKFIFNPSFWPFLMTFQNSAAPSVRYTLKNHQKMTTNWDKNQEKPC